MGVPKFYRWISERYPCLSSLIKEDEIPKFDNFYLDMNGIVHHCSHPNDGDVNFRITEAEIFAGVFNYVEVLFSFIRPQRILYLAIDGVAPRAKMNQQRGRRFRSAREAHEQEMQARRAGKTISSQARFDSNCITPGTDFMERLDLHLQYMIARKVSSDPAWRNVDVYYSSHLVPGEGEHKILDFIRYLRSQEEYDPNTRHCLYGLDADLIMLGLSVHEPFMSLLREEVKFGNSRGAAETNPEKITFHLLHLSVLRDYLGHEFGRLKGNLKFKYDIENIIDDWILMGFLVGNDFIPNLPGLHIGGGAFEKIYAAYLEILPTLGGYINESGVLNLDRFQALMGALEPGCLDRIEESLGDISWMEGKRGGVVADELEESDDPDPELWEPVPAQDFQFTKMPVAEEYDQAAAEADAFRKEKTAAFKEKYYKEKLRIVEVNEKSLTDLACEYVRAIQWNLHYYYHGVPSWEWYYPYNYAPFLSDLKNFGTSKDAFVLGKPFSPFEQLMAVLPERSKTCLPVIFHYLFGPSSPIYDFYPEDFATDMNEKKQDWEAVVLIPFIEETRLVAAVRQHYGRLTASEQRRNRIGTGFVFRYSGQPNRQPFQPPSAKYAPVSPLFAQIMHFTYDHHCLKRNLIRKGRHPRLNGELYSPGFPTLGFIKHSAELKRISVQKFGRPSNEPSMLLTVQKNPELNYLEEGVRMLGQTVFVNWPNLIQAIVVRVTDGYVNHFRSDQNQSRYTNGNSERSATTTAPLENNEMVLYEQHKNELEQSLKFRKGIDVGKIEELAYVRLFAGKRYNIKKDGKAAFLEPQWTKEELPFPVQLITKAPRTLEEAPRKVWVDQLYPVHSTVFVLGFPYYGCRGTVLSIDRSHGTVEVVFEWPAEPWLDRIIQNENEIAAHYDSAMKAASMLDLSVPIVSRLTGSVMGKVRADSEDRINIGLNLKATKANTEMKGYTKRVEQFNRPGEFIWLYSDRVLDLLSGYRAKFPALFQYLLDTKCEDPVFEDIYADRAESKMQEVKDYLTTLPTHSQTQQPCGSEVLDNKIIDAIQAQVVYVKNLPKRGPTKFGAFIHPRLLCKYTEETAGVLPDPTVTWEIYDRVINIREGCVYPVGARGTVISIAKAELSTSYHVTILFDQSFHAADRLTKVLEVHVAGLLNITYGQRKQQEQEHNYGKQYFLRVQPVFD